MVNGVQFAPILFETFGKMLVINALVLGRHSYLNDHCLFFNHALKTNNRIHLR